MACLLSVRPIPQPNSSATRGCPHPVAAAPRGRQRPTIVFRMFSSSSLSAPERRSIFSTSPDTVTSLRT